MTQYIQDALWNLIVNNFAYIGYFAIGLTVLASGLGVVKRLIAHLFTAALHTGDRVASRIAQKPKAALLGLAILSLLGVGCYAGYRFSPPTIIEKEVVKTIPIRDYGAPDVNKIEAARAAAEIKATEAQNNLAAVERARQVAQSQATALAAQVAQLVPDNDDAKLHQLFGQVDQGHKEQIGRETRYRADPRHYKTVPRGADGADLYHIRCPVCDQNNAADTKIAAILQRQIMLAPKAREPGFNELGQYVDPIEAMFNNEIEEHKKFRAAGIISQAEFERRMEWIPVRKKEAYEAAKTIRPRVY